MAAKHARVKAAACKIVHLLLGLCLIHMRGFLSLLWSISSQIVNHEAACLQVENGKAYSNGTNGTTGDIKPLDDSAHGPKQV